VEHGAASGDGKLLASKARAEPSSVRAEPSKAAPSKSRRRVKRNAFVQRAVELVRQRVAKAPVHAGGSIG
jgi:hypothetical protein